MNMVLYQITLLVTAEQEGSVAQLFRQRNWTYNKIGASIRVPDSLCSQLGKGYNPTNSSFLSSLGIATAQEALTNVDHSSFTGLTQFDNQPVHHTLSEKDKLPMHRQTRHDAVDKLTTEQNTGMKYTGQQLQNMNLNFQQTLDGIINNSSTGKSNMNNSGASVDTHYGMAADSVPYVGSLTLPSRQQQNNLSPVPQQHHQQQQHNASPVQQQTHFSPVQWQSNASSICIDTQNKVSANENTVDNKGVKVKENTKVKKETHESTELERAVKAEVDSGDSYDSDVVELPVIEQDNTDYEASTDESYTQENIKKNLESISNSKRKPVDRRKSSRQRKCVKSKTGDTTKVKKKQWNPKDRKLVSRSDSARYKELYGIHCIKCEHTFIFQKVFDKHLENDKCRHECEFCGKVFLYGKTSHYIMHMKYHNKEQNYKCDICGKLYIDKRNLEDHLRKHRNERPYMCDLCGQSFIGYRYLYAHKHRHHSKQPQKYPCPRCPKVFNSKSGIEYHTKHAHEKKFEGSYMCDVCGKKFNSKHSVLNHQIIHSNLPKSFKCDVCSAAFLRASGLREHKRRHAKQYSLFCSHCKKGFYQKQALTAHENMHTGTKPFTCDVCDYACAVKENLKKHMKIHRKMIQ